MDCAADAEQLRQLANFLQLLAKWNRAYSLTAITDPHDMVALHVLDSVAARDFLNGVSVLDAGSGAGLPGIPLAILDPARQFTLLDSGGKKIRFLRHVLAELALGNARTEEARVENYQPGLPFDTVICRAFTDLRGFVQRCAGLVAADGRLVAMKGRYPETELAAIPVGWRATAVEPVQVPGIDAQRHMVVLERA
ncbi:MAG: 16S rRNA (guanine(527)-N(7))-methyltransferase RsmG [Gammaproteobacteria bacterium]|nr:16S rRNA (guanine(527)-N(7))-methyltransferase RsmG [Gammaproteobacteria bacterium]